jgi:hypothetical protein
MDTAGRRQAADSGNVVFAVGDTVRVRSEEQLSVVVLPTDRPPDGPADCAPEDVPDVDVCCVPVALVRTAVEGGVLRWVQISDLTRVDEPAEPP